MTSPASSTPSGPPVPYRVTSDPTLKPLVYGEESVDGPDLKQRRESQAALKQMMAYGEQLVQSQVDPEAPPPIPPKRKHSEALTAMLVCSHLVDLTIFPVSLQLRFIKGYWGWVPMKHLVRFSRLNLSRSSINLLHCLPRKEGWVSGSVGDPLVVE